jgi:hypothetical protein
VHLYEDDLDGSEANETIRFSLDGVSYEIDLNGKNADRIREALSLYVSNARRVAGYHRRTPLKKATPLEIRAVIRKLAAPAPASPPAPAAPVPQPEALSSKERNRIIREWAAKKGIYVAPRGSIKQAVIDLYDNRESVSAAVKKAAKTNGHKAIPQAKFAAPK